MDASVGDALGRGRSSGAPDRAVRGEIVIMLLLMRNTLPIAAIAVAIAGGLALTAQNAPSPEKRITPAEVQWPAAGGPAVGTSGVTGIQTVVLKGDPTKAGLYTLLLRLGPNQRIQAHSHRDDRVATVVSGKWYFGYGRRFNETELKELPPGSLRPSPPGGM